MDREFGPPSAVSCHDKNLCFIGSMQGNLLYMDIIGGEVLGRLQEMPGPILGIEVGLGGCFQIGLSFLFLGYTTMLDHS